MRPSGGSERAEAAPSARGQRPGARTRTLAASARPAPPAQSVRRSSVVLSPPPPQAPPEGAVAVGRDRTGHERSACGRPGAQLPIARSRATSVGRHIEPAHPHKLPFDRAVAMVAW